MVGKVLKKHDAKSTTELSDEEKSKVKDVVEQIQSEVEKFLQNQNKTVDETDFEQSNQAGGEPEINPLVQETLNKLTNSNNDVSNVKTFIKDEKEE